MNAEKLTKEIFDKYPLVFKEINNYCRYQSDFIEIDAYDKEPLIVINSIVEKLPFNFLYALLEDFFMENGIESIIDIQRMYYDGCVFKAYYMFTTYHKLQQVFEDCDIKTKNEAKYQAIIKSCEILEAQL